MPVDFRRYTNLHPEGKHLIQDWFERAWNKRDCSDEDAFEPFIFCYISFNAWASCVTQEDRDWQVIQALKEDNGCVSVFETTLANNEDAARKLRAFQDFWPIFSVSRLRRKGISQRQRGTRLEIVNYYLNRGANAFCPGWPDDERFIGVDYPPSWPNMLSALYQVRCNLFHGEKTLSSEADRQIVGCAFRCFAVLYRALLDQ